MRKSENVYVLGMLYTSLSIKCTVFGSIMVKKDNQALELSYNTILNIKEMSRYNETQNGAQLLFTN